jgi:hypothetical protein
MQQLETSKQIVEAEQRYRRECKGRALAISRRIYRLLQTDVFYVESESTDNVYYFVKFKPDVVEYCTCPDNSLRGGQMKCKHLHAIEFAIRFGTLRDIDRLPTEAKVKKVVPTAAVATKPQLARSYTEDDYSF